MSKHDELRNARLKMHAVLITAVLALVAGRIATVINPEGDAAFLSANDRSRWVSVAALVERQTFEIDDFISIQTKHRHRVWDTIDKVRHVGSDGRLHYYSSKPTLLTTMIAGVYWGVHEITGLKLSEHPIYVTRLLLLLINLPLLALFLITMTLSVELSSASDMAKRLAVVVAGFATMLTPFAISLNNHLFAAAATSLTLYLYLRASEKISDSFAGATYCPTFLPWTLAGASAAFAVACELPALSMFALWAVLFALLERRSLVGFFAGAAVIAVGIFGTNYWAHQSWKTPYAHRGDGEIVASFSWQEPSLAASDKELKASLENELSKLTPLIAASSIGIRQLHTNEPRAVRPRVSSTEPRAVRPRVPLATSSTKALPLQAVSPEFEVIAEFERGEKREQQQWKVRRDQTAKSDSAWQLLRWDDWYDYPSSYWRAGKRAGVDRGEPSRVIYAFQATLGYYGIFSLTPIWLLMPIGLIRRMTSGPRDRRYLAAATLLATVVCFVFYIARPEIDRNYGGVSVCFRWMLWFIPLWVYGIITELDRLSERWVGWTVVLILIAASIFSVSTSLDSPWQSPWLYRFATFLHWKS